MTFEELKQQFQDIISRVTHLETFLKIDERIAEREKIEEKMSANDFWNNSELAQETVSKLSALKNIIEPFKKVKSCFEDVETAMEFALEEVEMEDEAVQLGKQLIKALDKLELLSFLSGKFDSNNCYFTIHAGAGGTESCDWAAMLMRMYIRYFERKNWGYEVIETQQGDEAGIKSVTFHVKGEFAFGYTKAEKGVHRLVRISPFDSNARRHTSFASVDTFPELSDDIDIEIDEKDLKVDTFRASGAGGQHVNTTDSAIRITHVPSGIVVSCQAERSQHKNRSSAMKMLKAKLYEREEEQKRIEANAIRGEKTEMGWGNQIRSYVLHPYQMVKDLRTEHETGNAAGVLDGNLDAFIEAYLKSGLGQ